MREMTDFRVNWIVPEKRIVRSIGVAPLAKRLGAAVADAFHRFQPELVLDRNMRRLFHLCPWILVMAVSGCHTVSHHAPSIHSEFIPASFEAGDGEMPRELFKTVLPPYRIEPPDILIIESIHIVPRGPYSLRTSDVLSIQARGTFPDAPIEGAYVIGPGGLVNFGLPYGSVKVTGMTTDEAAVAIDQHLRNTLQEPFVLVSLLQMAGMQQIAGEHLVKPDGTVTLGAYGSVFVVGKTLAEAKLQIEGHLSRFLENPEVSVDVFAFNSKVYYVITEGAGLGDGVTRFPVTGNETALDAIANVGGLTQLSSKRMWIARPSVYDNQVQILPINWVAITAQGAAETNYQILPGDRIFVAEDGLVAFDTGLGKLLTPIERIMGFTLLGTNAVTRLSGNVLQGGGLQGGFGGGFGGGGGGGGGF